MNKCPPMYFPILSYTSFTSEWNEPVFAYFLRNLLFIEYPRDFHPCSATQRHRTQPIYYACYHHHTDFSNAQTNIIINSGTRTWQDDYFYNNNASQWNNANIGWLAHNSDTSFTSNSHLRDGRSFSNQSPWKTAARMDSMTLPTVPTVIGGQHVSGDAPYTGQTFHGNFYSEMRLNMTPSH